MLAAFSLSVSADDDVVLSVVTETGYSTAAGRQVFSGDEIRQQHQTLGQFLQSLTGVQVQHSGAIGDPVLVSLRGASAGQTNILVNGVKQNDAQGGGYDISEIPLSMIERVELITAGSHGASYDSAIGGTLNIITRNDEYQRMIRTAAGSAGYRQISYRQMAGPVAVYAETVRTDNDFTYPVPTPFDGGEADTYEALNNAGFYRHNLQLSAQTGNISSRIYWRHQNKEIPDYFRNSPNNEAHYEEREAGLSLSHTEPSSDDGLSWQWHSHYSNHHDAYRDRQSVIGLGNDDNRYQREHAELLVAPQWRQDKLLLNASAKLSFDDYHARYVNDSDSRECLTPQGQCDQSAEQWVSEIQTGAGYQWTSQISTQFYLYQQQLKATNWLTNAQDSRSDTTSQRFSGGSAEVSWQGDHASVRISGRNSVRLPSLYERYGDRGLMLGNDDLVAETADTYSIDNELYTDVGTARLTVFRRDIENVIVPTYDSRGIGRYQNTSQATLTGLESDFSTLFSLNKIWFEASFGATYYRSQVQSEVKSFNDKQLAGIYHERYNSALKMGISEHSLALNYEIAGNLYIDRSNALQGDIRESLDMTYLWQKQYMILSLAINNLTDNRFRDYTNRPAVGRSLLGAIEFEF